MTIEQKQAREWLDAVRQTHPNEIQRLFIWFAQVMAMPQEEKVERFFVKVRRRKKKNETPTNV